MRRPAHPRCRAPAPGAACCHRAPGRAWEGLVPPCRCHARRSRGTTPEIAPPGHEGCSSLQLRLLLVLLPHAEPPDLIAVSGSGPLVAAYCGKAVENELFWAGIPVKTSNRNNAGKAGHWVRGLSYAMYSKGLKQRCPFSRPSMDVQFPILSAVEQMLLIIGISR